LRENKEKDFDEKFFSELEKLMKEDQFPPFLNCMKEENIRDRLTSTDKINIVRTILSRESSPHRAQKRKAAESPPKIKKPLVRAALVCSFPECGKAFDKVQNFNNHVSVIKFLPNDTFFINFHFQIKIHQKDEERVKIACAKCGRTYYSRSSLNRHKRFNCKGVVSAFTCVEVEKPDEAQELNVKSGVVSAATCVVLTKMQSTVTAPNINKGKETVETLQDPEVQEDNEVSQ
jgi:hypothetical protein